MYLAMSRVADREGYPEVAEAYKRIAFEEAEHAAKFAELLGEVVSPSTKENLQARVDAETGACAAKAEIAKRAKEIETIRREELATADKKAISIALQEIYDGDITFTGVAEDEDK